MTIFSRPETIYTLKQAKEAMAEQICQLPRTNVSILRYELPIEPINILSWLHNQNAHTNVYWSGQKGENEIGGIGVADVIKDDGPVEYTRIFNHMRGRLSAEYPLLRYYGGMCFDPMYQDRDWGAFGTYQFIIPQFEIIRTKGQTTLAFNVTRGNFNAEDRERTLAGLRQLDFSLDTTYRMPPRVLSRADFPDHDKWGPIFDGINEKFRQGSTEKVVLARKSVFDFNVGIRPSALMKHLKDQTPGCFHFCFQPSAGRAFLGATPECLYKRDGRTIKSEAIAGTRPRGSNTAKDKELESQLLNSDKDAKEHRYVVDMLRKTLGALCQSLQSDETFGLKKLRGSQHLQTSFKGILKDFVRDDQILQALHPTPAVGGHPTAAAMKAIRESESFSRGWYAGPVGTVGFDSAEFAVAIRSGLIDRDRLSLYAGAGIVSGSTATEEWDEIENKISNFINVFHKDK